MPGIQKKEERVLAQGGSWSMPGRAGDASVLHAELTLTKTEGSSLSGVLSSSHFNEEPVVVSAVKTSVFMRSIHNSHLDRLAGSETPCLVKQVLWASLSYRGSTASVVTYLLLPTCASRHSALNNPVIGYFLSGI